MKQLDELYEITNPKRNELGYSKNLDVAASRLNDLVDGKRKDAFKGVTFQELRDLILSINKSPILEPYSSSTAPNESVQQQRSLEQQQQPESLDNVTQTPPLTDDNDQSCEQHQQQPQQQPNHPSLNNFVSFGSLDSTGSHDPAIVGFLPPVSSAGIIFPAYPVPLQPGQLPPFMNNGTAVYPQSQPQLQEHQVPMQQQQPPTGEFSALNLNDQQNKQVQGGERQGDSRFKGPRGPRKEWNRGNKNGPPRDHRNRNQDGRTQGAPNDSQRHNNRGPREHNNNNFPNGGGFSGRPRNSFNGPRAGNAASTVAGGTGSGQKV